MGKQDAGNRFVVFRLTLFQPKNLARGPVWHHRVPKQFNQGGVSTEFIDDLLALFGSRSIAPQFRRSDYFIRSIEDDYAVLLSTHPTSLNFVCSLTDLLDTLLNGGVGSVDPFLRILLHIARGEVGNKVVLALS